MIHGLLWTAGKVSDWLSALSRLVRRPGDEKVFYHSRECNSALLLRDAEGEALEPGDCGYRMARMDEESIDNIREYNPSLAEQLEARNRVIEEMYGRDSRTE